MSSAISEVSYVGLGANLGDPELQIRQATQKLESLAGVRVCGVSALYSSAPWGLRDQPDFVNGIVAIDAVLSPRVLIESMLAIERSLGRSRDGTRWGPRRIDLDLILFGDRVLSTAELAIPHPRFCERAFVLLPLIELATRLGDPRVPQWQQELRKLPHADVVRMPVESTPLLWSDRAAAHSPRTTS